RRASVRDAHRRLSAVALPLRGPGHRVATPSARIGGMDSAAPALDVARELDDGPPWRGPRLLRAFRYRDFRLLWIGMLLVNAMMPLQFTTSSLYLLDRGGKSGGIALVGVLAAVRGSGMLLFALFGGVLA